MPCSSFLTLISAETVTRYSHYTVCNTNLYHIVLNKRTGHGGRKRITADTGVIQHLEFPKPELPTRYLTSTRSTILQIYQDMGCTD